jgi:hypothetical protein
MGHAAEGVRVMRRTMDEKEFLEQAEAAYQQVVEAERRLIASRARGEIDADTKPGERKTAASLIAEMLKERGFTIH